MIKDLEQFLETPLDVPRSRISLRRTKLHLYIEPKATKTLVVFFSAAVRREAGAEPPFFSGRSVGAALGVSFLCFDDPILQLDQDLSIAWHAGALGVPLQRIYTQVIRKVAKELGADRLIFAGGSAGGFASIFYASRFPGSLFFAVNPQTDISKYAAEHVERYAGVGFGWTSEKGPVSEGFGATITDLPRYFAHAAASAQGLYLQNDSDTAHIRPHALPLIVALGGTAGPVNQTCGDIRFQFANWGKHHQPLPADQFQRILQMIVDHDIDHAVAHLGL